VWVWENGFGGSGAGPVGSGAWGEADQEHGASRNGKECQKQVGTAVRESRSAVPERSRSERSSGVRTGGGTLRQPCDRRLGEKRCRRCPSDSNLYIKSKNGEAIILVIYVNDIIVTSSEA
jgi:hypothetical protein